MPLPQGLALPDPPPLPIGLALVLGLLVFATWNDLVYLREIFRGLIT